MTFRDDKETEQIGKLIDAGHPELAAEMFRSRFRYRAVYVLAPSISFAAAAVWHFVR